MKKGTGATAPRSLFCVAAFSLCHEPSQDLRQRGILRRVQTCINQVLQFANDSIRGSCEPNIKACRLCQFSAISLSLHQAAANGMPDRGIFGLATKNAACSRISPERLATAPSRQQAPLPWS